MSQRYRIATDRAPGAIGPYSQAIVAHGVVYCSGQIPLDPQTMTIVEGDIRVQTQRALDNLSGVLAAAGTSLHNALKTTVYLADMADFPVLNGIYAEAFGDHRPARSTVAAAGLPKGARVEIELIARIPR